ncbi:type IV toxin-antitoxin system AbiEi family antitoxin domain-containing protein [Nocardiopsis sediminis]|uniref:Type IV toxin-antitoxin system AbiEi family antitoxin domain-containing protein n=1 Tax=Nocardiopsis sediminis TaxID=1778267 RepID=A0ABV8FMZ8_9ACTN
MLRSTALTSLADLAEEQWGLFTRRQAEAAGMAWSTLSRLAADEATVERVAHGVYRLRGAPPADHLDLRAAWLQLAPGTPVWERTPDTGVVSHRSAAALHGLGHLPADVHEFTLPARRQTRRPDVRLHRGHLAEADRTALHGLPVTRPARTAADLLADREDPGAVAHVVADALRAGHDHPATVTRALSPHATRFGLRRGDGHALLRWLLDLTGAPEQQRWLDEATDPRGNTLPP